METRGFPTPPHDGCGFINFPVLIGKQAVTQFKRSIAILKTLYQQNSSH
jgi:hypothetical protein